MRSRKFTESKFFVLTQLCSTVLWGVRGIPGMYGFIEKDTSLSGEIAKFGAKFTETFFFVIFSLEHTMGCL